MIAAVAVTERGRTMARRLPGVALVEAPLAEVWRRDEVEHVVAFLAVGAAVRLIAPWLDDKRTDAGLVCVDEAGRYAVAVLGGHRGANALAVSVAGVLGAEAVVTTASDAVGVTPLEDFGLPLEPNAAVAAALVEGRRVLLVADRPWPLPRHSLEAAAAEEPGVPAVVISDRDPLPPALGPRAVLRPPTLVLGVGASSEASPDELVAAAVKALNGWSVASVRAVATLDRKRDQVAPALGHLAPVVTFAADELAAVEVPSPSATVAAAVGTPSVAEAAALLAAGPGAELVVGKVVTPTATAALARVGPARTGEIRVIGLGPGHPDQMTRSAQRALEGGHVVVGYQAYVDSVRSLLHAGQRVEGSPIGDEMARAQRAVALAAVGWTVALLGSGDAGIYGLAGPVLEVAGDVAVTVHPGVTAATAAASLLGAPLTHDHCAVSLSDLLTPWPVIERRLEAAAAGDFVVALYNPRSAQRRHQLAEARRILLAHRPPATPVGVVSDAYRPGQRLTLTTLADLDEDLVGMTTVVVVGSRSTKVIGGRMVTPRGYAG